MARLIRALALIITGMIMISTIGGCSRNGGDKTEGGKNADSNPDKINSLEKVKIGGVDQWIYINGNDDTKPVLLFLHGGPGYSMLPLLHQNNPGLEEHFVVVSWDQRGAGLSYSKDIPKKSMKLKHFVRDVHELTTILKKRFNQSRIYIFGHSYGTVLALKAVNEYPDDYRAYIGSGQVVDIGENERLSYDFAMKTAKEYDVKEAIKELTSIGRPDEDGNYSDDSGYDITMGWVEYFGGDLYGKTGTTELENQMYSDPVYKDKVRQIEEGLEFSQKLFDDEDAVNIDFRQQIKEIKVPVYILAGRYDYDTPSTLAEQYFNIIKAPGKELVWFENSAHFPFYEEPQKFNSVLIDKILAETLNTDKK